MSDNKLQDKSCTLLGKKIAREIRKKTLTENDIYQVYGTLLQSGEKETLALLATNKIGRESPMYDTVREQILEQENYLINPVEVAEGVTSCPKCGSNKTFSAQKQTRGSDEPMTTFSRCVKCHYNWSYSG